MQGLMFLPDGKALIMDNELYKKTIESSIVLDLLDTQQTVSNSSNPELISLENNHDQDNHPNRTLASN